MKVWKLDLLLLTVFLLCMCTVMYCYPVPHLTWDSFYYVKASASGDYGIRPAGYAVFLSLLYHILPGIGLVAYAQFIIYFLSSIVLLRVTKEIFNVSPAVYIVLGLLLVTEPVALYHANSILSDILFSAISTTSLAALLWYLSRPSVWVLGVHLLLVCIAIEVRLIALFYPFFTCVVLLAVHRDVRSVVSCAVVLLLFGLLWQYHISANSNKYGVSIYSAFSDWTVANNALYALHDVDAQSITDPEIKAEHLFFRHYMDTSSFNVSDIGSAYLWDDASPLNYLRIHYADSLHLN